MQGCRQSLGIAGCGRDDAVEVTPRIGTRPVGGPGARASDGVVRCQPNPFHLSGLPVPPTSEEEGIVTKKEIVKTISEEVDLTQLKTKEVVQKTFDAIIDTLVKNGRIELRNFGVFEVKKREPRKARNPRTGAEVYVPAKNVVTFKPGKEMADKIRWAQAVEA
jgi:nucleoid DNA-binding protein